jgi:YhcH/YjgK/YiaL family protein
MIIDLLTNSNLYNAIHPRITLALEYLAKTDFNSMSLGKYEVDGTDVFAIVNEYETKDAADCLWEAHRKYIDIHYILRGSELIGTTLLTNQLPTKDYDTENDYWLFGAGESKQVLLPGMFAIFYPQDIHSTSHHPLQKSSVRKVVMKVLV